MLSHAAGAELTRFPVGAEDPLQLTSGARGYEDMLWTSASAPAFPLEFRWQLRQPVALSHFQVNQHPYWPTRDIQLLVEDAQGRQQVVWSGVLPEGRPDKREPSFVLHYFDEDVTTVSVILRVLSGYHTERCGLDSLELYGAGAAFTPDGTSCSLSSEIKDLTPGSTIYYRIVLDDGGESLESGLQAVSLPLTLAPIIESAAPLIRARNPACYAIRANAMGLETELWGELRLADGQVIEGQRISLGSQPTGRHIYYVPDGLPEAPGAIFHLCARNAAGDATLPARFPCR